MLSLLSEGFFLQLRQVLSVYDLGFKLYEELISYSVPEWLGTRIPAPKTILLGA